MKARQAAAGQEEPLRTGWLERLGRQPVFLSVQRGLVLALPLIMADLCGPKTRIGEVADSPRTVGKGECLLLGLPDERPDPARDERVFISLDVPELLAGLRVGMMDLRVARASLTSGTFSVQRSTFAFSLAIASGVKPKGRSCAHISIYQRKSGIVHMKNTEDTSELPGAVLISCSGGRMGFAVV